MERCLVQAILNPSILRQLQQMPGKTKILRLFNCNNTRTNVPTGVENGSLTVGSTLLIERSSNKRGDAYQLIEMDLPIHPRKSKGPALSYHDQDRFEFTRKHLLLILEVYHGRRSRCHIFRTA
jgi:hypothetical protein